MPRTYCWSPVEGCEDPATAIRRADAFDMLDRHGYVRGDNEHTGRAILLISDLAHIYKGSLDHPFGPYVNEIPPSRTEPAPPEPASQDAVLVRPGEVKTSWPPAITAMILT